MTTKADAISPSLRLSSGRSEVVVSALGAEVLNWHIDGRELIWQGDPSFWSRRSPLLFPFCGWLRNGKFRAKGREYATDVHGFGKDTTFELQQVSASEARLTLHDTPETRAQFPFAFVVEVFFTVTPLGWTMHASVRNPGNEPLPFALGYHPGYVWPFAGGHKDQYRLEFSEAERPDVVKIAPGGLFTPDRLPIPLEGRVLDLSTTFNAQDSLILTHAASRRALFRAPNGDALAVTLDNFPHWVLWTLPGGAYLCIEGWNGQGDPQDFTGDLMEKPGMIHLAPGEERHFSYACEYLFAEA